MSIKETLDQIKVVSYTSKKEEPVYRILPEAKFRKDVIKVRDTNEIMWSDGLISKEEYDRVRKDCRRLMVIYFDNLDTGRRMSKDIDVRKLIFGSKVL
jgi:hypothetical protein